MVFHPMTLQYSLCRVDLSIDHSSVGTLIVVGCNAFYKQFIVNPRVSQDIIIMLYILHTLSVQYYKKMMPLVRATILTHLNRFPPPSPHRAYYL